MGINLFIEGRPSPFAIKIELPKEISTFKELKDFSDELLVIDEFYQKVYPKLWEGCFPDFRKKRKTIILSLRVSSPPIIQILTDPAWLTVFLAFIIGYKQIKENTKEINNDIRKLLENIRGLTLRELDLLEIAIRMTLDKNLERLESFGKKYVNAIKNIRRKLIDKDEKNGNDEEFEINIKIEIKNSDSPWFG